MAERQRTFPKISPAYWWTLREAARKNNDIAFSAKNIAELLNIKAVSVYATVYPSLNQFELIDKDGKLSDKGRMWITDDKYKELCIDLLENIYPIELIESTNDPLNNRKVIEEWFERKTNASRAIVLQMTATYLLLYDANPVAIASAAKSTRGRKSAIKIAAEATAVEETKSKKIASFIVEDSKESDSRQKRKYTKKVKPVVAPAPKVVAPEPAPAPAPVVAPAPAVAMPVTQRIVEVPAEGGKTNINISIDVSLSAEAPIEKIDAILRKISKYLLSKESV